MAPYAFATLLTSDSYLPGALVTASSLIEVEQDSSQEFDLVCLITLSSVSVQSVKALRQVFDLVINVDDIRSSHCEEELNLLGRQDLGSTVTKIHIWRLVQYEKVIYLDADTLPLRSLSHLFLTGAPFSACPDVGWPDCFNSGLLVITPSKEIFEKIHAHFLSNGSWDGGDQGLLNDFFVEDSDARTVGDIQSQNTGWNRLSFVYNVTPSAYYTYAPAYKRYGDRISMVHFIGHEKPWHLINRWRSKYRGTNQTRIPSLDAIDYDSLVNKWFGVYERAFGTDLIVSDWTLQSTDFKVPKYLSQWDAPRPSEYHPPNFDQLKEMFTRNKATSLLQFNQPRKNGGEGAYISMPFSEEYRQAMSLTRSEIIEKGKKPQSTFPPPPPDPVSNILERISQSRGDLDEWRGDLSYVMPQHWPDHQQQTHPSDVKHDDCSHVDADSVTNPLVDKTSPPNQEHTQHENHPVWDASQFPPPSHGYQMKEPIIQRYEAAWDNPNDKQSQAFFESPSANQPSGYIPSITHQDYSKFTSSPPQPDAVKPVFPWESRSRKAAGRVFPKESTHYDSNDRHARERLVSNYSSDVPSDDPRGRSPPPPEIQNANLSQMYQNAWDQDPMIGRWAQGMVTGARPNHIDLPGSSQAWDPMHRAKANLVRTPHLEFRGFIGNEDYIDDIAGDLGESSGPDMIGRSLNLSNQDRQVASAYRMRRDSENSSRDADESDTAEDEESNSDGDAPRTEELEGQLALAQVEETLRNGKGRPSVLDDIATPGESRGSHGSVERLPTMRSVIIGVPVESLKED